MAITTQEVNETAQDDRPAVESNNKLATMSNGLYCEKGQPRKPAMPTTPTMALKSDQASFTNSTSANNPTELKADSPAVLTSTAQADQEPVVKKESDEDKSTDEEKARPKRTICKDHTALFLYRGDRPKVVDEEEWKDSLRVADDLIEGQVPAVILRRHKAADPLQAKGKLKDDFSIVSPGLQAAFRSVVKFYPKIDTDGPMITIPAPFEPLYFYFDQICAAAESNSDVSKEELGALKRNYTEWILPEHEKIRKMISQGQIQFSSLWALFRPGDLIYTRDDARQSRLFVLVAADYRKPLDYVASDVDPNANVRFDRLCMDLWSTDWDCINREFQRFRIGKSIRSFLGHCPIESLPFYPLDFYKGSNKAEIDKLLSSLEERGRCWKRLVTQPPCCRHYCGPAWDLSTPEVQFIDERVIVDVTPTPADPRDARRSAMALQRGPERDRLLPTVMSRAVGNRYDLKEGVIVPIVDLDSYSDYDDVPPGQEFKPLQAQLCPAVLRCYATKSRRWFNVEIGKLTDVLWVKTAFDHLVLDESTKSMLASLVERHQINRDDVLSDVIPLKSRGLAIVLHGPPGVGKTLTAETIAERAQKILLRIDIGELTAESDLIDRLRKIFDSAARWDAVLLLDEADVLLEKRSFEDLRRNGVVSIFLRMIEYFDGVIFMTTNRIETMDVAFQSRIHVAIKYPPMSPPFRRQIWERFIQRLDEREVEAKRELEEHLDDLEHWELNGRQIRNVLSIAESIALNKERRRGALRYRHVEEVANATLDFQHFFDDAARDRKTQAGDIGSRQFQERRGKNFSGRWG